MTRTLDGRAGGGTGPILTREDDRPPMPLRWGRSARPLFSRENCYRCDTAHLPRGGGAVTYGCLRPRRGFDKKKMHSLISNHKAWNIHRQQIVVRQFDV